MLGASCCVSLQDLKVSNQEGGNDRTLEDFSMMRKYCLLVIPVIHYLDFIQ